MALSWLTPNLRARRDQPYGDAQRSVITAAGVADLAQMLEECPAHRVTPLHRLPILARRLGLADILVKDESQRFGFGAFKALGGVLAVYVRLTGVVGAAGRIAPSFAELMAGTHKDLTADLVFTTASSGNHGRSVAAGAKLFGNRCVVFLPFFTSADKEAAIRARGAEVVRVDGDYDAAVAECRRVAAEKKWAIISDTSWDDYEYIPKTVMRGYTVLAHEAMTQWKAAPTHIFMQAGVGGLAAAVIGYLWEMMEAVRPIFIVVEPVSADCWFQSNRAGQIMPASGDADTVMGGLACREISPITWPVIGLGADWFMTIGEDSVPPARQALGGPTGGDPVIASGPSGCAGMAGLLRVQGCDQAREALRLNERSRVLLINSEGNLGEAPI
jgi:diaminopropionate ammonia-lyase